MTIRATPLHTSIAIDIGGTFTDIVSFDGDSGVIWNSKVATTPDDHSIGFDQGVQETLKVFGTPAASVKQVFHGTTIATNLILESKGAPCALITTQGFRHVLELARHDIPRKSNLYAWSRAKRPVKPERIFEVAGRIGPDGAVLEALDELALLSIAQKIKKLDIQSVAVCLIHSYANPTQELLARKLLLDVFPEAMVSLSCEVLPVFREYERAMVTLLNSYVMPSVSTYVGRLESRLTARSIHAPLLLMKSSGGVAGVEEIKRTPVQTALSGPAAGVVGAAFIGKSCGFPNLITIDIGGTSADISLIRNGQPNTTTLARIGEWPVSLPMIDIHTIGAGGGSIASISESGGLLVGPRSAGAVPGPAAYARGGTEPTVTDAHLVLGHLPPYLLQGSLTLSRESAEKAIRSRIAQPLGLSLEQAARGILAVVDNNMVGAIRVVSIERGHDPRDFVLLPFGGAGPLHGSSLARLLGIEQILIPPAPGVLSALGLLVSDLRSDYSRTCLQKPPHYNYQDIEAVFQELESRARQWIDSEGMLLKSQTIQRNASIRYQGQGFELSVPWSGPADPHHTQECIRNFHEMHRQLYTFAQEDAPVEIVTLGVTAVGVLSQPKLPTLGRLGPVHDAVIGHQQVAFEEGLMDSPVYDRRKLGAGATLSGPAIITQLDATTVLYPEQRAEVDRFGALIVQVASG